LLKLGNEITTLVNAQAAEIATLRARITALERQVRHRTFAARLFNKR
jgi:cell division protein FtsB